MPPQEAYRRRRERYRRAGARRERFERSWVGQRLMRWLLSKVPPAPPPGGGGVREPRRPRTPLGSAGAAVDVD